MKRIGILSFFLIVLLGCNSTETTENSESNSLLFTKVADHVYQHTSFLTTKDFGKVPCNGMIVFDGNEAIVFDTPTDNSASKELIKWVQDTLKCEVKAVVSTHFHEDCLGGLEEFHKNGIPSYANNLTIELAKENKLTAPENGFDGILRMKVGDEDVLADYLGEGHTNDNVIGYFPSEKTMFGGCLIKELGAGKGNLEDANVSDWAMTVVRLKEKYPDTKIVIPGHGELGGTELLDYTIKLFQ